MPDHADTALRAANVAVVRGYLDAWTPVDVEAMGRLFHPEITFELGYTPEGVPDLIQGRDAVLEFLAVVPSTVAAMNFHDVAIATLEDPAELVAEYRGDAVALPTGRGYRNEYIARARIEDGTIRRYKEYSNPLIFLASFDAGAAEEQRPGCPTWDFDPLAADHVVDPWPVLAKARAEQPVFYMPEVDMWAVTRHEDVREMLRDTETFSSADAIHMVNPVPDEITIPAGCPYPDLENVAQFDPPVHTRLRKLMQPAFTPKRVRHRIDEVRGIADALIDDFIDKGRVDMVTGYANPIPVQVMAMILGFPPEAAAKFRHWTDSFFSLLGEPGLPHDKLIEIWEGLLDSDQYTRSLIEERRARPADDMLSDLVTSVSDDGSPSLTDEEITANMHAFIVAGTDTTAIMLTQMVYLLLEDRSRWEAICADHDLIGNAVEETLRYRGPIRGLNRKTTRDCELGGVAIPKGARLYWMVSSANLDEAKYDEPDRFDLHRKHISDHLGFGAWTHFCIGAPLARLEGQVALEQLVTRLPGMRLAEQSIEWVPNLITPAPASVIVEW